MALNTGRHPELVFCVDIFAGRLAFAAEWRLHYKFMRYFFHSFAYRFWRLYANA